MGGGGSNAVNRMIEDQMRGVTFVPANTDAQALAITFGAEQNSIAKLTRGLGRW